MKRIFTLVFLVFFSNITFSQIDSVLISSAKFKESKFNNAHAGSGFLLKYQGKVYAITAKHVLLFAKTDSMKTVSFGKDLKEWAFTSKLNNKNKVVAGRLINENKDEAIVMPPEGDWLIFEVKGSISKDVAIYNLKEKPLEKNESLYFLGYPYKNTKPIKIKGTFISYTKNGDLSLDVPKGSYGGCSGGPVLDSKGRLAGIVSMGYFNKNENKMIFEPASLAYFKTVINNNR